MLYLPGILDGSGWGLNQQHESLTRLFKLRCLEVPIENRISFRSLLEAVESAVIEEAKWRPRGPLYMVGEGFGGAVALAVAARNPDLDLVLILVNPATSFPESPLQSLLPLFYNSPWDHDFVAPLLLNFIVGIKPLSSMPSHQSKQPGFPTSSEVLSKETLLWKLTMLQKAANYANSRLHAVNAQVLVLASGNDHLLRTFSEANRLKELIKGCRTRKFSGNGYNLLQEKGFDLSTWIKATGCYRHSHKWDPVLDYSMVTKQELETYFDKDVKLMRQLTSPVFFSTSADGEIVQGLSNIPTDRPIMLVGYHMLLGMEVGCMVSELLREKNILVRGLGHPSLLSGQYEDDQQPDPSHGDLFRLFGAVPSYGRNMYKLLKHGYSTLLYPGGTREALHRKGEDYKLFWPENPEFVQMAARHGVTIIPFGAVGADDMLNLALDLNDLRKYPALLEILSPRGLPELRQNLSGEIADQQFHLPVVLPKGIGRFYFLFQKPIVTAGREEELRDRKKVGELYRHVKGEVETALQYLQEKRKRDPFRHLMTRVLYESPLGQNKQAPTFIP